MVGWLPSDKLSLKIPLDCLLLLCMAHNIWNGKFACGCRFVLRRFLTLCPLFLLVQDGKIWPKTVFIARFEWLLFEALLVDFSLWVGECWTIFFKIQCSKQW
jgi:hypothetical protein